MIRTRLVVVGLLISAALGASRCGGSTPPTAPSSSVPTIVIAFVGAPFTATVEGKTISADGQFTVALAPGTHEISGSFTSGLLVIAFGGAALGRGGVESGSLVSVDGAFPQVQQCGIGWGDFTKANRTFRVKFTVTANSLSACQ
jgi:hypothetical protein